MKFAHGLLMGGSFAAGFCAYAVYKYWRRRQFKAIDEGFEDVSRIEESPVKKILFLGLQGAGKTTIIKQLSDTVESSRVISPTAGFSVTDMDCNGVTLSLWEVAGGENYQPYWGNFYEGTDLLVFVVDSADLRRLSLAVREVAGMLADPRLARVPVLLVAHKQDLSGAMTPSEVAKALDIERARQAVSVVGTRAPPGAPLRHASLHELETVLLKTVLG